MDEIEAEVFDDGRRKDSQGRQVLPEEEWNRLLDEYERSGLTQKAFARREGINVHTLVARLGRRRKSAAGMPDKPVRFQELSLSPVPASALEVHLPAGLVLRGASARDLAELVLALRKERLC